MSEIKTPSNPLPSPKLLAGDKACAAYFGLSEWTIRQWRLSEGLPVMKIGGRFYFNPESVSAWLAARETSGPAADEPEQKGTIREIKA